MGRSFLSWVSGGVNRLCFSISDKLEMDTDTVKLIFFQCLILYLSKNLRPSAFLEFTISFLFLRKIRVRRTFEIKE